MRTVMKSNLKTNNEIFKEGTEGVKSIYCGQFTVYRSEAESDCGIDKLHFQLDQVLLTSPKRLITTGKRKT